VFVCVRSPDGSAARKTSFGGSAPCFRVLGRGRRLVSSASYSIGGLTGELGRSIKQIARGASVVDLQASPFLFSPIINPVLGMQQTSDEMRQRHLQTACMGRRLLFSDQQVFFADLPRDRDPGILCV
jgi:hypothetical protein